MYGAYWKLRAEKTIRLTHEVIGAREDDLHSLPRHANASFYRSHTDPPAAGRKPGILSVAMGCRQHQVIVKGESYPQQRSQSKHRAAPTSFTSIAGRQGLQKAVSFSIADQNSRILGLRTSDDNGLGSRADRHVRKGSVRALEARIEKRTGIKGKNGCGTPAAGGRADS